MRKPRLSVAAKFPLLLVTMEAEAQTVWRSRRVAVVIITKLVLFGMFRTCLWYIVQLLCSNTYHAW